MVGEVPAEIREAGPDAAVLVEQGVVPDGGGLQQQTGRHLPRREVQADMEVPLIKV